MIVMIVCVYEKIELRAKLKLEIKKASNYKTLFEAHSILVCVVDLTDTIGGDFGVI